MTNDEIDRMPAGPGMDRLIRDHVTHAEGEPTTMGPFGLPIFGLLPEYSTDLNAAVEACGERQWTIMWRNVAHRAWVDDADEAEAPTPALALCRALLKSLSEP